MSPAGQVPVGPGMKVTLNFSLRLTDGVLVDSTGGRAASFVIGDGQLLPGFERLLFGLCAGAAASFEVPPEIGFGSRNDANIQEFPRSSFRGEVTPVEGLVMSFADAGNSELAGIVRSVDDAVVVVDFNHPLAGETLLFEVDLIEVERVTNEIIRVSG